MDYRIFFLYETPNFMKIPDVPRNLTHVLDAQKAIISKLEGPSGLVVRLCEFGFTEGESVRVLGRALFGGPIYVEVRGAIMALRKEEAACLKVQ